MRMLLSALVLAGLPAVSMAAVQECPVYSFADLAACVRSDTTARLKADIVLQPGQQLTVAGVTGFTVDGYDNGVKRQIDESSARFHANSDVSSHFIRVIGSSRVTLKDLVLKSSPATDNYCAYPGGYYNRFPCLGTVLVQDARDVTVTGVAFQARKTFQLQLVDAAATSVTGSTFQNAATFGIWMASHRGALGPLWVTGNTFSGSGANAVIISEVNGMWLGNNTFVDNHRLTQYGGFGGGQILFEDSERYATQNVDVTGNIVRSVGVRSSHGVEFANYDRGMPLRNVNVIWNRIERNGQSAIKFDESNGFSRMEAVNVSNNEYIYNVSPYKSQVVRSAFGDVRMAGNWTENGTTLLTAGFEETARTCVLPPGATHCNVDIRWNVNLRRDGRLRITVRSAGTQAGDKNRGNFSAGITGSGQQAAPWIDENGAVFEMFYESDYASGRGWEAPVASVLVKAVRQ